MVALLRDGLVVGMVDGLEKGCRGSLRGRGASGVLKRGTIIVSNNIICAVSLSGQIYR